MAETLDGRHGAGAQCFPFHDGGIHATRAIELQLRACPGVEQAGGFQEADRRLHRIERWGPALHELMPGPQRIGQKPALAAGHGPRAGSTVGEDDRTFCHKVVKSKVGVAGVVKS